MDIFRETSQSSTNQMILNYKKSELNLSHLLFINNAQHLIHLNIYKYET
jgi:hypothetical protein